MRWLLLCCLLALAACGGYQKGPIPPEQAQGLAFRADGPPKLTLITLVNNRTGNGAHTALMINASQRVIFDPAGPLTDDRFTRYGDVLYGITPTKYLIYRGSYARGAYRYDTQEIEVSPEVAEQALRLVEAYGAASSAFCANSTSSILRQLPGFEAIDVTFYPVNLSEQFAAIPGVQGAQYFENDAGQQISGPPVIE